MLHIIQRARKINFLVLMMALASQSAFALKDDVEQPLNIVSKEQIADFESNKAIFIKDVVATQGSMELHADKAEL